MNQAHLVSKFDSTSGLYEVSGLLKQSQVEGRKLLATRAPCEVTHAHLIMAKSISYMALK